ncbi:hypothetical protein [Methylobacterium sp. 285MFTsu5.1]|uniref:hypothetical protein n=1 Tax=Methylobacterium sp. 285MFTsu5.1 TaxID=1172187 RepID=UPI000368B0F3|nr:hypothetical protein [Methylobacterium sp. 285MFTsu5.1]
MRFRTTLAAFLTLLSSHALAYDATKASRYASPDMYRPNVDRIILNGPGSTGDVSGMSVTPNASAPAQSLSRMLYAPTFGGTAAAPTFKILDPTGAAGSTFASDGHANWNRLQSGITYNPVELVLYGSPAQGQASVTAGGNTVTRIDGNFYDPAWVGQPYFYFAGTNYKVASVAADGGSLTVTNLDGSAVSFPANQTELINYLVTSATGTANVSGTAVTWVSGQLFLKVPTVKLNGTVYNVASVTSDGRSMTLATSAGTQSNVSFACYGNINNQISTIRVQKLWGASEENLTLAATPNGFFINTLVAGVGKHRKLTIGSGAYTAPGGLRAQLGLQPNGDLTLGGDYGLDVLRVLGPSSGTESRWVMAAPSTGTSGPVLASQSDIDANVPVTLQAQGSGALQVKGYNGATTIMQGNSVAGATSFPTLSNGVGQALVTAGGANGPVVLIGKNAGIQNNFYISASDPTTSDIPNAFCADWYNSTANTMKRYCNVANALRAITYQ